MSNGKNSGISILADRYALALIGLAEKYNCLDQFLNDLNVIVGVFKQNKDLSLYLEHPTMPIEEKKDLIKKVFENHISQYLLNFLMLLLDRNRIKILPNIAEHYLILLNKKRNIATAYVTTAIEVDQDIINKIKNKLEQKFQGMNIEIKTEIDTSIIAGMILKIGDKVIDGSIRTKLENMKKQLI